MLADILTVVAAALFSGILAPVVFQITSPWPFWELDTVARRRVLRAALGPALGHAIAGLVVGGLAYALSETAWIGATAAVVAPAILIVVSLRFAAPLTKIAKLGEQLDDDARRDGARAELLKIAEARFADETNGPTFVISIATVLSNGRLFSDSLALLERVPADKLDEHEKELRALGIFACRVFTGDLDGARAFIAEIPALEPGGIHDHAHRNTKAQLLVVEGEPDAAIELIGGSHPDPDLERNRRAVLAHAHAARGDELEAGEHLRWLLKHHPVKGLRRVLNPEGPASARARAMARGDAGPYGR